MRSDVFEQMLRRSVPIETYMLECSEDCRLEYEARRTEYTLNPTVLENIKALANQYIIVAISADWCKDCISNIPVLDLVREATKLPVYILGGVKTEPLNSNRQWAVPPSPPEVDTLDIKAIPTILIYTKDGNEVGRIIENPSIKASLEEELLHYMKQ